MARIRYRNKELQPDRLALVVKMNSILAEYNSRVSVRQLYYRLVAADVIPNNDKQYDRIQGLITDARYAGLIDWDAIEDRNREPSKPKDWATGRDILTGAHSTFRLNRWKEQPFYVELWVEKAALAGVLAPISRDYHITLMVNRGYSSASAMKESADRIRHNTHQAGVAERRPVILYIGDHDPSGEHMVKDIQDRLLEFDCPSWLDVRKLALTMEQIEEHKPPPNPVKMTDTRANRYVEEHGESSWEVDALPPKLLDTIIRRAVNSYIDKPKMEAIITKENLIKAKIKSFADKFVE